MRVHSGVVILSAAAVLTGCATTGALRRATEQQQAALAQQSARQDAALSSERAERSAADSDLARSLGMVRGDVQALRGELQTLKTQFSAKISMLEDGMHFALPVNFAFNDATVRLQDTTALGRFAHVVSTYYPGSKVTIEGFADPAGSSSYNVMLSRNRAMSVRSYLVTRGLTTTDMSIIGYGKTRLVAPNAWGDMPGADLNRRVVFVIESRGSSGVASLLPASNSTGAR